MSKAECVSKKMSIFAGEDQYKDKSQKQLLGMAYGYCKGKSDFDKLNLRTYELIRRMAIALYENGEESYIINDSAAAAANISGKIEPLKPIAQASTSGSKTSSNVSKMGYHSGMLDVEFNNGGRYVYFVGPDYYDNMAASQSKGEFVWEALRGKDPGLVYPAGPKKTPGGVGGSIEKYAKVGGSMTSGEQQDPKLALKKERKYFLAEHQLRELEYYDPEKKVFGTFREKLKTKLLERKIEKTKKLLLEPYGPEAQREAVATTLTKAPKATKPASAMGRTIPEEHGIKPEGRKKAKGRPTAKALSDRERYIRRINEERAKRYKEGYEKLKKEQVEKQRTIPLEHGIKPEGRKKARGRPTDKALSDRERYLRNLREAEEKRYKEGYEALKKPKAATAKITTAEPKKPKASKKSKTEEPKSEEKAPAKTTPSKVSKKGKKDKPAEEEGETDWQALNKRIKRLRKQLKTAATDAQKKSIKAKIAKLVKRKKQLKKDFEVVAQKGKKDFDTKDGKWVTIKGKHIFIKKGQKVQFGKGGRFSMVSKKEHKAKQEKRTKKVIEETGHEKETAEAMVKSKRSARKEAAEYRRAEDSPKTQELETKRQETQQKEDEEWVKAEAAKIRSEKGDKKQSKEARRTERSSEKTIKNIEKIKEKASEFRELAKSKTAINIFNEIIHVLNQAISEDEISLVPFAKYYDKINRDKSIKEAKKEKIKKQIAELEEDNRNLVKEELKAMGGELTALKKEGEDDSDIDDDPKPEDDEEKTTKKPDIPKEEVEKIKAEAPNVPKTPPKKPTKGNYVKVDGKSVFVPDVPKKKPKKKTDMCGPLTDFIECQDKFKITYDYYHAPNPGLKKFRENKLKRHGIEITNDSVLYGVWSRAGPMEYKDEETGEKIILYKEWDNILEEAEKYPMIPMYGSRSIGSHEEREDRLIGFIDNWEPNNETQELYGQGHTFRGIEELSDLRNPSDLSVSLSYYDDKDPNSKVQKINGFRHGAVSLNNMETDRCSSVEGWGRCVVSPISDFENPKSLTPGSSSPAIAEPRKIIKNRGLNMPEIDEILQKIIDDFKEKYEEDLGGLTGNEVAGDTNYDNFVINGKNNGYSDAQIEAAWKNWNFKPAVVPAETMGFKKTKQDFEDAVAEATDAAVKAALAPVNAKIAKFQDFFTVKEKEEEAILKAKFKIPLSEEKQKLLDDFTINQLRPLEPYIDALIEEHPEIIPNLESASQIQDMNSSQILKELKKTKEDARITGDLTANIKTEAEKLMAAKWAPAGGN